MIELYKINVKTQMSNIKTIKTSEPDSVKEYIRQLNIPRSDSHKGQNGKVLIIGGSSLFHSASIWAAEVASHFVDIVHYCSTEENNRVFLELKKKFHNGIIVRQEHLMAYVKEDDAILVGSGMMRDGEESKYTYKLTKELMDNFPDKKFVFDAGALQMMEPAWLLKMKTSPILTPHQKEFEDLFKTDIKSLGVDEKAKLAAAAAAQYHCVILLKAVDDIISDGHETVIVKGGNAGLTKGGTGDILAGLTTALYGRNCPMTASIAASCLLKKSAEELSLNYGYWYNVGNLIDKIPQTLTELY